MAAKGVVDAVEARLAASWNRCPVFGLNLNSNAETPRDGSDYLVVQYPVANEEHVGLGGIGERIYREEGGFRLVLHVARGTGAGRGLTWMDELRALFRGVTFDGVACLTASSPPIGDGNGSGNYFVLTAAITYYYDLNA
jgi:hypothetical protein